MARLKGPEADLANGGANSGAAGGQQEPPKVEAPKNEPPPKKKREKKSPLFVLEMLKGEDGKPDGNFKLLEHEGKMFNLSEADALILDEKTPLADYAIVRVLKIRKPKVRQTKLFG